MKEAALFSKEGSGTPVFKILVETSGTGGGGGPPPGKSRSYSVSIQCWAFKWRFAGRPIIAHFFVVFGASLPSKKISEFDPL